MIYSETITLPASTSEAAATTRAMKITKGLVWLVQVEFPAGCVGLVHVRVFDASYQVLPATPGESLRGDGVLLTFDDLYIKGAAPYFLTVQAWNDDELYEHTIQVRVGIAATRAFQSRYMPSLAFEDFEAAMAEAAAAQEATKAGQLEALMEQIIAGDQEGGS